MAITDDILTEAYEQRRFRETGFYEKTSVVGGEPITLYSRDGVHWFSRKADIGRWEKVQREEAKAIRKLLGTDDNLKKRREVVARQRQQFNPQSLRRHRIF